MKAALLLLIFAQAAEPPAQVRLDFPETVELAVIVDYVSATLGLNVLYDEAVQNKKVSLRVHEPVPRDALLGLLQTVLRSRGLALVAAEQSGWLKIVPAERLAAEAGPVQRSLPPADAGEAAAVTLALQVLHADLQRLQAAIGPYLSKPGGSLLVIPESNLLVVTDYARNVRRVAELAELLDVAAPGPAIETIPVRHQEPAELAATVNRLLAERARLEGPPGAAPPVSLQPDPLTGGIVMIGPPGRLEEVRTLVERFDVPVARRTELYQPRYLTAGRLKSLVEQLVAQSGLRAVADEPSNTLAVTAREEEHARIRELLKRFDTARPESATPLRFYKLLNRRADDVFATLGTLLGATAAPAGTSEPESPAASPGSAGAGPSDGRTLQIPPPPAPEPSVQTAKEGKSAATALRGESFALSLDPHTNAIIAIAPPELHRQIEQLVQQLDKRRPQVLVEVTLVSVSADDSLNLGVELQTQDLDDRWAFELFTSFGLSTINPTTGQRRLAPLVGGSGVLLAPDEVPLIIQALANRGDTRVYSAPRILVDDNATGRIESVAEAPFTSVNASNTVATTSFAGFAKAGTQLMIEPHIAEGDHLEINYTLTVSSFTGAGTGATPPPRSSDTISSTIRVPDGHTVIVGGLLTETLAESASRVPLIGDVPVLGWLFGNRQQSQSKVRLYAFIRPTILRDEGFEDLKYLSAENLKTAGVDDGYPPSRYQYVR